jgi:hypothetical protein
MATISGQKFAAKLTQSRATRSTQKFKLENGRAISKTTSEVLSPKLQEQK